MLQTLSTTSSTYDPNAGRVSIEGKPLSSYQTGTQPPAPPAPGVVNQNTGKTNAQVLQESTDAARKAAEAIGGTYTMAGGFSKSPVSTLSSKDGETVVNGTITPAITTGTDAVKAAAQVKAQNQAKTDASQANVLPSDMTDTSTPLDPVEKLQKEQADIRLQKDAQFQKQQNLLSEMAISNTGATSALVSSLQNAWAEAKSQQDDANTASEAMLRQVGVRSGTSRYAPTVQGSLIDASRAYGIAKLGTIDALYTGKITEAQTQLQKGNLQLALQAATAANKYLDDASSTLTTMITDAKKVQDKQQQATRDYAIASLYKQGTTDPTEIMQALSEASQASGYGAGDFTLDEIGKAIKNLDTNQNIVTQSDGSGNLYGIDKETGSIVWSTPGVTHVTKTSGGGTLPIEGVGVLTPTNKNDLAQAGLDKAPPPVQSYFLNTPTAFRDSYQRDIASGKTTSPATLDDMLSLYTAWYDANKKSTSGGTHDWGALLGTTTPAK